MGAENTHVDALAVTIRDYLRDHPHAADTVHGIARWWLAGRADNEGLGSVQRAVEQLVKRGEMTRQVLRDGTVIFERNKEHDRR